MVKYMDENEIKKQDKRWMLLGLLLIGFFIISLLISFNSGFKQGVFQVLNCEKQGSEFIVEKNSYLCDSKINNSLNKNTNIINNYDFNFTGVET